MPDYHANEPLDSYLSTTELLELTGISRKALRVYERDGICTPAFVKSEYYKYWTLDQANEIREINELSQAGMAVKDIATLASAPGESLLNLSYKSAVARERKNRRHVKSLWMQHLAIDARRQLDDCEGGWYLRYLPQRWMAIVPVWPHAPELIEPGRFMNAYRRLSEISEVVGWATSPLAGQLSSIGDGDRSDVGRGDGGAGSGMGGGRGGIGTSYIYLQLANAPMPVPVGRRPADSGCYLSAAGEENSPLCSARHCKECALFGRRASDGERERWQAAEADARARGESLHDRGVTIETLREPYITGAWSVFTKHRLDPESEACRLGVHGPTMKARFMPQDTTLPYGVTACVLPQGVYLCRSCPSEEASEGFSEIRRVLETLETDEVSPERERAALERALEKRHSSDAATRIGYGFDRDEGGPDIPFQRGFSREPLAAMLSESEPEMRNWHRRLEESELSELKLRTNVALEPEDGYVLVTSRLPGAPENPLGTFEFQVLVDAGSLGPEPAKPEANARV